MTRDLRDPLALGHALETLRNLMPEKSLSEVYDFYAEELKAVALYSANPSCVDKYGRPDDVQEKWERIKVA